MVLRLNSPRIHLIMLFPPVLPDYDPLENDDHRKANERDHHAPEVVEVIIADDFVVPHDTPNSLSTADVLYLACSVRI